MYMMQKVLQHCFLQGDSSMCTSCWEEIFSWWFKKTNILEVTLNTLRWIVLFLLSGLDRDRIAVGSEEGLYVIEVTRDGKLGLSACSDYMLNNEHHKF